MAVPAKQIRAPGSRRKDVPCVHEDAFRAQASEVITTSSSVRN
jgi:hypothetical protein